MVSPERERWVGDRHTSGKDRGPGMPVKAKPGNNEETAHYNH